MKTKNKPLSMFAKKTLICALSLSLLLSSCFVFTGCDYNDGVAKLEEKISSLPTAEQFEALKEALFPTAEQGPLDSDYADEAYAKLVYIDKVLKNRDCLKGDKFKLAQKWIIFSLMEAGYKEGVEIVKQDTFMTQYAPKQETQTAYADMYPAVDEIEVSTETYNKEGRKYVLAEGDSGDYVQLKLHTPNIIVTKKGKSDKTIIVGAHYDGDGSGDNGSSVALAVTTAQHLFDVETECTIKFVFFTAEEVFLRLITFSCLLYKTSSINSISLFPVLTSRILELENDRYKIVNTAAKLATPMKVTIKDIISTDVIFFSF
jgi:hypothetical protein